MALTILLFALDAATVAVPVGPAAACAQPDPDQIVVCGRRIDRGHYRLPALPPVTETTGPPRAEWGLGGGVHAGVSMSQAAMPQGAVSRRVMVTVKIPV